MDYVSQEQLDYILAKIYDYGIPMNCIKSLLNIEYMQDMTVKQYNFLKLIIYQIESKWNGNNQ